MLYVKTFLISSPILGVFYHFVTTEPMPWWPDTVVMGAFMGALATFLTMRLAFARRAIRHLGNAARASRDVWNRHG
jgi:hypothetical protein